MAIRSGDDGTVFYCDQCGAEAYRTIDEPFPEVVHYPDCKEARR